MNSCTTVKTCRTCGEKFDAERPQSILNPSACIECATLASLGPREEGQDVTVSTKGRWEENPS